MAEVELGWLYSEHCAAEKYSVQMVPCFRHKFLS